MIDQAPVDCIFFMRKLERNTSSGGRTVNRFFAAIFDTSDFERNKNPEEFVMLNNRGRIQ